MIEQIFPRGELIFVAFDHHPAPIFPRRGIDIR